MAFMWPSAASNAGCAWATTRTCGRTARSSWPMVGGAVRPPEFMIKEHIIDYRPVNARSAHDNDIFGRFSMVLTCFDLFRDHVDLNFLRCLFDLLGST